MRQETSPAAYAAAAKLVANGKWIYLNDNTLWNVWQLTMDIGDDLALCPNWHKRLLLKREKTYRERFSTFLFFYRNLGVALEARDHTLMTIARPTPGELHHLGGLVHKLQMKPFVWDSVPTFILRLGRVVPPTGTTRSPIGGDGSGTGGFDDDRWDRMPFKENSELYRHAELSKQLNSHYERSMWNSSRKPYPVLIGNVTDPCPQVGPMDDLEILVKPLSIYHFSTYVEYRGFSSIVWHAAQSIFEQAGNNPKARRGRNIELMFPFYNMDYVVTTTQQLDCVLAGLNLIKDTCKEWRLFHDRLCRLVPEPDFSGPENDDGVRQALWNMTMRNICADVALLHIPFGILTEDECLKVANLNMEDVNGYNFGDLIRLLGGDL
ncbi:MAG: hypothetical protein [Cressdnaviricota sp.]|nr:MAG: hypothetical protein [Cressdnaviricota sp.]